MYDRIFFRSAQNVTDVSFFVVIAPTHTSVCLCFLTVDMCYHLMNEITSLENDVMDKTHPLA